MANIDTKLEQILTTIYGEQMRQHIHDVIKTVNKDLNDFKVSENKYNLQTSYSSLPCYDFGNYYAYDKSTANGPNKNISFNDSIFDIGSLVKFVIADRDTDLVELFTGNVSLSGAKNYIKVEHPFKRGHTYQAIITERMSKAEVVTDNGVFIEIEAREAADKGLDAKISSEKEAREKVDGELQASIDKLNGADTAEGSVAKTVKDAINAFASALTDDGTINTYAEALNWIQTHGAEYTALLGQVTANKINIKELRNISHTHDNKDVIDGITAEDVEKWRDGFNIEDGTSSEYITGDRKLKTFSSEVKQTVISDLHVDSVSVPITEEDTIIVALAKLQSQINDIKEQGINTAEIDALNELLIACTEELHLIYRRMGINQYDGGVFESEYDNDVLDGGSFDEESEESFDCGEFDESSE